MMDSAGSDGLQCNTALVGRELGRYRIEIAGLSETRFAEVGERNWCLLHIFLEWTQKRGEE